MIVYVLIVAMAAIFMVSVMRKKGAGRNSIVAFRTFTNRIRAMNVDDVGKEFKKNLNKLTKKEFNLFKVMGVSSRKKSIADVSRGGMKFDDIQRQMKSRPSGKVLSLACGRGGWEQRYAGNPAVTAVYAITYGPNKETPGHEAFSDRPFAGKEKVHVLYQDIRQFVKETRPFADWIFYDGGEQRSDYLEELRKSRDLIISGVLPAFHAGVKGFVLKVLNPYDSDVLKALKTIQTMTNKGNFVLCSHTRQSNTELYFVSTPQPGNLSKQAKILLEYKLSRIDVKPGTNKRVINLSQDTITVRTPITGPTCKKPNMQRSIAQLGPRVFAPGRNFRHWESLGVYPFGSKGSTHTNRVDLFWGLIRDMATYLTNFFDWGVTDTTAEGFQSVFIRKVDVEPVENSEYHERLRVVYRSMAKYFRSKGFSNRPMKWNEILSQANMRGAAAHIDSWANVGNFLTDPIAQRTIEEHEKALSKGNPMSAVFCTMGKREKKKGFGKGSRMVAYLPIPMRMVELKYFGRLQELTKPVLNKFGVGGYGLHDLGMRVKEVWKGYACADDVAGFDTRIGASILHMELEDFILPLTDDPKAREMISGMYGIYSHPHILIPALDHDFVRSELLVGRGQRMSGTAPTYSMNTITRLAIAILQFAEVEGKDLAELPTFVTEVMRGNTAWGGLGSGDDFFCTSDLRRIKGYSKTWNVLNSLGFKRKDMLLNADSPICVEMNQVDFCSHRYEEVWYRDTDTGRRVVRYQPTRTLGEIFGKAGIWIAGNDTGTEAEAWMSAQSNQLAINYHHVRDCRRLAFMIKAVVRPNIVLGMMKKAVHLPRPWMQPGDQLDVLNDCLFGTSTHYPIPGFRVREWSSAGYIDIRREKFYEPNFQCGGMVRWRNKAPQIVDMLRHAHGGDGRGLENLRRYELI